MPFALAWFALSQTRWLHLNEISNFKTVHHASYLASHNNVRLHGKCTSYRFFVTIENYFFRNSDTNRTFRSSLTTSSPFTIAGKILSSARYFDKLAPAWGVKFDENFIIRGCSWVKIIRMRRFCTLFAVGIAILIRTFSRPMTFLFTNRAPCTFFLIFLLSIFGSLVDYWSLFPHLKLEFVERKMPQFLYFTKTFVFMNQPANQCISFPISLWCVLPC